MEKFNQAEYKKKYDKEHYTFIHFKLKKPEAEKFKQNLKVENIGITEFFKKCIENYKEILNIVVVRKETTKKRRM